MPGQIILLFHSQLEKGPRLRWVSLGCLSAQAGLANVALNCMVWLSGGEGKLEGSKQDHFLMFPVYCFSTGIHCHLSLFFFYVLCI